MTYCRFCLWRPSLATVYYHGRPLEVCAPCGLGIGGDDVGLLLFRLACRYAAERGDVAR